MADQIDILTAAIRTEFINGFSSIADPAPIEKAIITIPSTARQENYPWMAPVPGVSEYKGFRKFAKIANIKYTLPNKEYSDEFEINTVDLDDDQTGGFAKKGADLGKKMKLWPGKASLQNLGLAASLTPPSTTVCFDGSQMFATAHNFGTGGTFAFPGNIVSFTCANPTGNYRLVALVTAGDMKPMIWQNRQGPDFQTDSGTPESKKAKLARFWCDSRGAPGFSYWYHSCLALITGTPTIVEMQQVFGLVSAQFRSFALPIVLPTDVPEFVHEQVTWSANNLLFAVSAGIEHITHQALTLSLIGATDNAYKGFADLVATNFLN